MTLGTGTTEGFNKLTALALAHYKHTKTEGAKTFANWLADARGITKEAAEAEELDIARNYGAAWYIAALYIAAKDRATDSEILGLLAESDDIKVKLNAAENGSLSQEVIEKLSHDADITVRWAVVRNSNAPLSAIKRLARANIDDFEGEMFEEEYALKEDAQERLIDIRLAKDTDEDEDTVEEPDAGAP